MKHVWGIGLLASISVYGCVSMDDVDSRMNRLRTELRSEIRQQTNNIRDTVKNDIKEAQSENKKDINNLRDLLSKEVKDVEGESHKNVNNVKNSVMKEINELKDLQKQYAVGTDTVVVDHQRQIAQNKELINDLTKRTHLLESIATSRTSVQRQGQVTSIDGDIVSISLGSTNGVRAGDYFAIYKETEKIGIIKIDTVDVDSARATIVGKVTAISIGDRAEPEKTQ